MIVIVGSRDLWLTPEITGAIVAVISTESANEPVGVRSNLVDDPPSPVERFVAEVAPRMGRIVKRWKSATSGRSGVYRRDFDMVEEATRVIAFFAPEQEMVGGTGHVVKAALDRSVPVEAYGLDERGRLEMIGSDEGDPMRAMSSRPGALYRLYEEIG